MRFLTLGLACTFAVTLRAQTNRWQPSRGHTQLRLWPAEPSSPDSESFGSAPAKVAGKPWLYVANVTRPTITLYSPSAGNTGVAVVVFPGGGYNVLAIDLEGTEISSRNGCERSA